MFKTFGHINTFFLGKIRCVLSCALITSLAVFVSLSASAQFADSPCDPKYYESLEARAWLEAQREITQNQNLIVKPDSVLEYTCFDKHLGVLARDAETMFSETTRWGTILPATSMDTALTSLVAGAARQYQQANFNHSSLGGRGSASSTLSASASPGAYSCEFMNQVWEEAKCMGFIDSEGNDGFFTFEEMATGLDKRFLPTRCSGSQSLFTTNINTAYKQPKWLPDNVDTMLNDIFPENGCGPDSSKVRTGLTVRRGSGELRIYEEHICVAPGCHYVPSSATAGECTQ